MVNNFAQVIGTVVKDFEFIGNGQWSSWIFHVQVEKLASRKGASFTVPIQVYDGNNKINCEESILGKQVCVQCFIDSFVSGKNALVIKLVAASMYIFSGDAIPQELADAEYGSTGYVPEEIQAEVTDIHDEDEE